MTSPDNPRDLLSAFAALLRLPDAERAAELARIAGTDPAAAKELESLIAHAGDDGEAVSRDDAGRYVPGVFVDAYRIERFIGAGGMGEVYEATEVGTVTRRVALKVMASDAANRTAEIRFDIERQAMAMLEHPGIARLLGGGLTEERRPYLVMDLIEGRPLLDACDDRAMGVRERLQVMAKVCDAVHHAHLRGIVHRDLTPWNILTRTLTDGVIEPVIIDFGVAKAMVSLPGRDPFQTSDGREPGTPAYMSPEQLAGGTVGPTSDVFSLGVILHELLTGGTPIPRQVWQGSDGAARRRLWQSHGVPSLVATFDRAEGADRRRIVRARSTGTAGLRQELRSELASIPACAMRLDPIDRYRSAAELADDLRALIEHRPLRVLRHRRGHRVRAFVRRHRGRGIPVALASLVGVSVMSSLAWDRASLQRQRELEAERVANMTEMFDLLLPEMTRMETAEERQAIGGIAARVDEARASYPELFARFEPGLSERLGWIYRELGRPADAEVAFARAIDHAGGFDAQTDPSLGSLQDQYITVILDQGRHEEALGFAQRAVVAMETRWGRDHGASHVARELVAAILEALDRQDEADRIYEEHWTMIEARETAGKSFDDWPSHHTTRIMYAAVLMRRGERERPEAIMRDEIVSHYRYEPDDPGKWNTIRIFGDDLEIWGEYAEALAVQREVLRARVRLYGEDGHPTCDSSRKRVARLEARLGLEPGEPIPGWPDESVSWNPPEGRRGGRVD